MNFISYGQNAEDVMLWRALRHVANGFYLDVGANDPSADSVTRALYDRGWRGINIEPVPRHYDDLVDQRPEDINLQLAIGAESGTCTLYEVESVRGWGTLDADMAEQYRRQGYGIIELPVAVATLAEICREHVRGEIHILKVDVEGAEEQVFRGMDFSRWRPWIILAESRIPTEQGPQTAAWEPLLLAAGYSSVYFDGVNTFYLADEHRQALQQAFTSPPSVLDNFIRYSEWLSRNAVERLVQQTDELRGHVHSLETALQQDRQRLALQEQQLATYNQQFAGYAQQLAERDQRIALQEERLIQQDRWIEERDQRLALQEQRLKEQAQWVAERDQRIALQAQWLVERDQRIALQEQQLALLNCWIAERDQQLVALQASISWKVTAPLRSVRRLFPRQEADR